MIEIKKKKDHLYLIYSPDTRSIDWVIHIDQSGNQRHFVRCELSLPVGMDDSGHITAWGERIILPELPIDPDDLIKETEEYAPEQEIIVKRKA